MLDQTRLKAVGRAIAVLSWGAGVAALWWVVGELWPNWAWHIDRASQCVIIGLLIALLFDSLLKQT